MVVDTSAVVAILQREPERDRFIDVLAGANDPLMSAATLFECSIVMHRRGGDRAIERLDELLLSAGVRCVALDIAHVHAAREAWTRYGKGRAPAALNFGDCFSYALATTTGRPLLFKGDDFARTDVTPATV
ncbi:MAG TPA: type II toxin-antitoxin system VapC family toxin [Conexibacter sp.]|jgi:ribonuclease VapC|nr:type II toxin-antitoxin system VapC family toxin [Conexibacter sp.]